MMVSSPTVTKPITRAKNHADYDNDSSKKGLSPLSRSLWNSPPNTSSNHRSPTPAPSSSQRTLFGFEQVENIENDKHVSKKKCSKKLKEKQDSATSKSTTAAAFSELFSEGKSSGSALLSAMVGGRSSSRSKKSVLLGPRLSLSRRQSKKSSFTRSWDPTNHGRKVHTRPQKPTQTRPQKPTQTLPPKRIQKNQAEKGNSQTLPPKGSHAVPPPPSSQPPPCEQHQ